MAYVGVQEVQTAIAQMKKIATNFLKSWQDSEAVKDKHKQLGLPQHELIQVRETHIRTYLAVSI